ncbi:zinc finger protein [Culex quinquefasciatus]|uniref:Zinc finger protein n=1 Tax=Culex quinquefasciatus TaxID=7176 RepID=B0WJU2_CULQU|nr:zinc finger protein [Culex quinquefasciatus]|eukprot:XP_001848976.1 zinc finger protein [Culex quinquefasciatus]
MMSNAYLNPDQLRRDTSTCARRISAGGEAKHRYGARSGRCALAATTTRRSTIRSHRSGPDQCLRQWMEASQQVPPQPVVFDELEEGSNRYIGEHHLGGRDNLQQQRLVLLLFIQVTVTEKVGSADE